MSDPHFSSGTHYPDGRQIMVIEDGQVKEYGTKEDVLPTLFQQKTGRMCGQEGGTC